MNKKLLKGTLQTIVLKLLSENKKMYGYEMTQEVKKSTQGDLIITEGALYPTLHKLEQEGLLTTEQVKVNGRFRKYYKLTENGRKEQVERINELQEFFEQMNLLLNLKLK